MTAGWLEYVTIFCGSAVLCTMLVPVAIRIARRSGWLDRPVGHKSQTSPVPYLGGVAIVLTFSLAVGAEWLVRREAGGHRELGIVLSLAVCLALLGLLDDLKNLPPWPRLVIEVLSGFVLWWMGVGVGLTGHYLVDMGLTILWVVGITNAFNLLDNMDGLAAGLVSITSATYFAIAVANGQFLVASLCAGLAGCSIGFLRQNRHPAQIYMGDGGALFLGFLVSYLGLKLKVSGDGIQTFLVPVLACSIAVLDTTLVTVARISTGRSAFQGGRDHVSHRLVHLGLPVPVAVGVIHTAAAAISVLSFVSNRVDPASVWIIGILVSVLLIGVGVLLLTVPVYPESRRREYRLIGYPKEG